MATIRKVGTFTKCLQAACHKTTASSYGICRPLSSCASSQRRPYSTAKVDLPRLSYGGWHTVTMIAGDGVGPELMKHVRKVIKHAGAPVEFEEIKLDKTVTDEAELETALLAIKRNGVAIKGNVESEIGGAVASKSRNMEMRSELDLFANVVRCRSIPGIETRHKDVDIIVIRENTEGEYSSLEHESVSGVVESLKIITERNSLRIAKYAFDYATRHNRKKVTCVHKANIMKLADGLFMECCRRVSEHYPHIEFDTMIVDNCSMQLVSKPQQFDVMVLPNLYGNIIANIGAGLVGGSGVVSGSNIGEHYSIFEMGTRPTGKKIQGMNIANPTAMLLTSSELLDHLGLRHHGSLIRDAVMEVIAHDQVKTPDIGGTASTEAMVEAVVDRVKKKTNSWY